MQIILMDTTGFEAVAALITSVIMVAISTAILVLSISRIELGLPHMISQGSLAFSIASTLLLVLSTLLLLKLSRMYGSMALRAEARHLFADIIESVLVVSGIYLALFMNPIYDLLTAIIVAFFMLVSAARTLAEISGNITCKAPSAGLISAVIRIATSIPGVKDCHAVRIRQMGGALLLDLHILVNPECSIREAHDMAHQVEHAIREKIKEVKDVVVHIEPYE